MYAVILTCGISDEAKRPFLAALKSIDQPVYKMSFVRRDLRRCVACKSNLLLPRQGRKVLTCAVMLRRAGVLPMSSNGEIALLMATKVCSRSM